MSDIILLETIKIEEGKVCNLAYHQARCTQSRKDLYSSQNTLCLDTIIKPPPVGVWRCRILYNQEIQHIEYIPYQEKDIQKLKIVSSSLDYAYKYADRTTLNALLSKQTECDDILIEKEGFLTDTSIANIALYDGKTWYTPSTPLLKGTMRAKLLDNGFLKTKNIKKEDLSNYTQVALMNAMIGFKIIKDIKII